MINIEVIELVDSISKNFDLTEDQLQDAYVFALEHIHNKALYQTVYRYMKKITNQTNDNINLDSIINIRYTIDDYIDYICIKKYISNILNMLNDEQRYVICSIYFKNKRLWEIGKKLQCTEETVKKIQYKSLRLMKKYENGLLYDYIIYNSKRKLS